MAPEEEIACDHVIKIPMDDNIKLTVRDYREALYEDIIQRKRKQRIVWKNKYLEKLGINTDEKEAVTGGNNNANP